MFSFKLTIPEHIEQLTVEQVKEEFEKIEYDETKTNLDLLPYVYKLAVEEPHDNDNILSLGELMFTLYGEEQYPHKEHIVELLNHLINNNASTSYIAYWYLGQLSDGQEAVDYFLRGYELSFQANDEFSTEFLSAIISLYMNSLPDTPDNRSKLEFIIDHLPEHKTDSVYVQAALYHMNQQNHDKAKALIQELHMKVVDLLKKLEDANETDDVHCPCIEDMISATKIAHSLSLVEEADNFLKISSWIDENHPEIEKLESQICQ